MRKVIAIILASSAILLCTASKPINHCKCNDIPLYGKVKIVEHFADFKVEEVDHFPDLKVKLVKQFPENCGEWQIVEHFPDFTITLVEHFPDFTIQYVEHFPGMN